MGRFRSFAVTHSWNYGDAIMKIVGEHARLPQPSIAIMVVGHYFRYCTCWLSLGCQHGILVVGTILGLMPQLVLKSHGMEYPGPS